MKQKLERFFEGYTDIEPDDVLYKQFENWFEYNRFKYNMPSLLEFQKSYKKYIKRAPKNKPEVVTMRYQNRIETRNSNNELHSFNGRPAVEWIDSYKKGTKIWYHNGLVHRINGPAIEKYDGVKIWVIKGKRHRLDGPAVIGPNLSKYYVDGTYITPENFREQFGG